MSDTSAAEAAYLARLDAMTPEEEVAYRVAEAGHDEELARFLVALRRGEIDGDTIEVEG